MAASIAKRSASLLALLLVVGGAYLLWGLPVTAPREATSPAAPAPGQASETDLPAVPPVVTEESGDPRLSTGAASGQPTAGPAAQTTVETRLHGWVTDSFDAPVSEVLVWAYLGRERFEARTDAAGRFAFDELDVGQYRLFVDQRSLAEGLLPPWRQGSPRPWTGEATGIHGTSIALTAGEDVEVELRVHRAGTVRGRVVGPDGGPLAGVELRALSAAGLELRGRSDELGFFRIDGAYPGSYVARVQLTGEAATELLGLAPLPFSFVLDPGGEVDLGALAFEAGGPVVAGRVIDQAGFAVASLGLSAQTIVEGVALSWAATTDAEGRFRIGRLPAQEVTLEVMPVVDLLETPPAPLVVDLSSTPELLEIPDWRVEIQERFLAHIRIEVNRTWLRDEGIVRYALETRELDVEGVLVRRMIDPSSAELEWSCATPREPFDLDVVLSNAAGVEHVRRQRVIPVAGAREELVFRFP